LIIINTETQVLSCPLTPDELIEAGNDLAKLVQKAQDAEEDHKATKSAMKAEEDALAKQITDKADIVHNKRELRPVEVRAVLGDDGMVTVSRMDTGEIMNKRKAKFDELQRPFEGPPTEK
jgi:hypothetical protein